VDKTKLAAWFQGWMVVATPEVVTKGGPGSGNWGHAGRPGQRGGSVPKSFAMSLATGRDWQERQQAAREAAGKSKPQEPQGLKAPKFGSTKEAEQWVESQGLVSGRCFFKGFDLDVAQQTVDSLAENINRVPQLKGQIKYMGNNREVNKLKREEARPEVEARVNRIFSSMYGEDRRRMVDRLLKKRPYTIRMVPRAYAIAVGKRDFYISYKWAKDGAALRASLENGVRQGWHPPGTASPKAIVDHEIGHVLEGILQLRRDAPLAAICQAAISNRDYPSQYARKNASEFIAEAWGEFLNNPNPGYVSQQVGNRIMEIVREGARPKW